MYSFAPIAPNIKFLKNNNSNCVAPNTKLIMTKRKIYISVVQPPNSRSCNAEKKHEVVGKKTRRRKKYKVAGKKKHTSSNNCYTNSTCEIILFNGVFEMMSDLLEDYEDLLQDYEEEKDYMYT